MIFIVLVFVAVVAIVIGAYWLFVLRVDEAEETALRKRLQPEGELKGRKKKLVTLTPAERLGQAAATRSFLGRLARLATPLQRDLTQADMNMTVAGLFTTAGCVALIVFIIVRVLALNTLVALAAAFVSSFAPFIYVKQKKARRLRQFEEQFPEAIDLIGRALRAGHAFTTGLAMAAEEIPKPVGAEFKLLYDRQNFGMPLPEAMRAFAARIPLIDARFFVTAVLTQRETGGNLGEVLDNLASVIRDRFRVKRQVRVLTAHGRITGWILAGMPPALAVAMFVMSPNHMMMLVRDPLGVQMIVGALVLQVVGTLIIRKLVDIPY